MYNTVIYSFMLLIYPKKEMSCSCRYTMGCIFKMSYLNIIHKQKPKYDVQLFFTNKYLLINFCKFAIKYFK